MRVKIEIECETGSQLVDSLRAIREEVLDKMDYAKRKDIKKPIKLVGGEVLKTKYTAIIKEFSIDELID